MPGFRNNFVEVIGVSLMFLKENDVILFQGDSVTDCGRNRDNLFDLGVGYPLVISSLLYHRFADLNLTFLNKAVSGDRVENLTARWKADCLELSPKPTVVSILIGINDVWRRYDSDSPCSLEKFTEGYRGLLTDIKEKLGARIVMLEPFVNPYPDDRKAWREDLDPKLQAVRALATEFGAVLVPLDGAFAAAYARHPEGYYSADGVHPSYAGHGLIASEWLRALKIPLEK